MTRPVTTDAPPGTRWSRAVVVAAFLAVHGFYTWMAVADPGVGFGDVGLYQYWAWDGLENGVWPVRDFPWVYPALALVPVTLPGFVSTLEWEPYTAAWMALVTALNAVATVALARRATLGALWWIAFLAFLGPVAFGRIDAIVVPLAICGLLFSATRPRVAAVLLTVGAWIKVAPGVLVVPLFAVARRPWREVVVPAAAVCAVVVGLVAAGGGWRNVASFGSAQEDRGLQLESVAASWWVVRWITGGDAQAYYNEELITWEIRGPGTELAADLLGWLLPLTVAVLCWLTWRARGRLADAELLSWSGLVFTLALIVTNKVGSPQFLAWLAAPVAVGLAGWALDEARSRADDDAPRGLARVGWPVVAGWALVIAALTHRVIPVGYFELVGGDPTVGWVLVVRNLLVLGLFAAAVARLAAVGPHRDSRPAHA
ncbi:MAG: DUF2029 domain-containing protein, partial [Actinomycetota bacterium]|nr:DUF2029 domain-containing protein [Actinomycetota bacterium]